MKYKSLLFSFLIMCVLLVGCNGDEKTKVTIDDSVPKETISNEDGTVDIYYDKTLAVDNNKVYGNGSTVPSIKLFSEENNYPEDLSKSRYSREVKDMTLEDGGWFISDYEDNHSIFITQDNDNEFKTTTRHGLLIFDTAVSSSFNEKEWTNYYFKGIYFNEDTNQFELKFVVDSKHKDTLLSVGLNLLRFNGYDVPQSYVSFDYYNNVKPDEVQLFTVYVDKTDDYSLDIDTISFNFEIYGYKNLNFNKNDKIDEKPAEIFMELSR